jgi:Clp amino terminal domain, pathogenicity island component/ClpX C4-type zinc finger
VFERFTDRARRVVVLSQEEARLLGHAYVGTEHLILGLLREGDGVAARALTALGVNLQDVRAEVKEIIGEGGGGTPVDRIPFTPRAKKALELSLREALQLGHNYIGTEHVLLGLIREGQGVAAQVLITRGLHLEVVRQNVIMLLTGAESAGVRPEPFPREGGWVFEPPLQRRIDRNTCSFCGRRLLDAGTMVTGYSGAICASCIRRAARVVSAAKKVTDRGSFSIPPLVIGREPRDGATDAVIATVHRAFAPHVAVADRQQAIEASGDPLPLDYLPRFAFAITRIQHAKASTSVELVPLWPSSDGPMVTVEVLHGEGNYVVSRDAFLNAVRSAPIFRAPGPATPYSVTSTPLTVPD